MMNVKSTVIMFLLKQYCFLICRISVIRGRLPVVGLLNVITCDLRRPFLKRIIYFTSMNFWYILRLNVKYIQ